MKLWLDSYDVYRFSPYEAIDRVHTPITKILLILGFLPWFAVWVIAGAMIGVVILLHDAVIWVFDL